MSIYCTLIDIKKYVPEHVVVQLTDDYGTNSIETEITDDAIDQAGNLIDTYMRGRYEAEMAEADVPAFINDMAVKISVYNLYRRKLSLTMPDAIYTDYKNCLQMLKDIQAGKLTPFPSTSEPTVIRSNKTSSSRTYSSTVWNSYNSIH